MDNDIDAAELAGRIADFMTAEGAVVGRSNAPSGGRFDFVVVRLPTGQEFTIRIEEN